MEAPRQRPGKLECPSIILNGVLADQEFADFREHRERRRRLAAGGAGAPPEAAIQADDRIADTDWAF